MVTFLRKRYAMICTPALIKQLWQKEIACTIEQICVPTHNKRYFLENLQSILLWFCFLVCIFHDHKLSEKYVKRTQSQKRKGYESFSIDWVTIILTYHNQNCRRWATVSMLICNNTFISSTLTCYCVCNVKSVCSRPINIWSIMPPLVTEFFFFYTNSWSSKSCILFSHHITNLWMNI